MNRAIALTMLLVATPALAGTAIVPDPTMTPGAVRSTAVRAICSAPTSEFRHWNRERDDRILAKYGLPTGAHPQFEIDHLIPLCLGGADSDSNLWPQPRRALEPEWNAERKDELEARLCEMACAGELDVRQAQQAIAEDWTATYNKVFREPGNFFPPAAGAMTPK